MTSCKEQTGRESKKRTKAYISLFAWMENNYLPIEMATKINLTGFVSVGINLLIFKQTFTQRCFNTDNTIHLIEFRSLLRVCSFFFSGCEECSTFWDGPSCEVQSHLQCRWAHFKDALVTRSKPRIHCYEFARSERLKSKLHLLSGSSFRSLANVIL